MFRTMAKEVMINVRLAEQVREDFKIAAELRGASMAGLLHQFIVKTIREEKEREPKAFAQNDVIDLKNEKILYSRVKEDINWEAGEKENDAA